jgi:glyoxylase-like metal-dependent hydrolase (beta-lactamase superfamily II)
MAHQSIVPFIQEMIARPHTVRPDSLAARALSSDTNIQGVSGVTPLSDGVRTIDLRPVENDHAAAMLIAHLPKEKVVFVSDLYSPPGPVPNPSVIFERTRATAFYDSVVKAGLQVETIVGGHGVVGSFRDLEKMIRNRDR